MIAPALIFYAAGCVLIGVAVYRREIYRWIKGG
jgi:hypothetical protein